MAKIRHNLEEGVFGGQIAQGMQAIANEVFAKKDFFRNKIAGVQTKDQIDDLVNQCNTRSATANVFARTLPEKHVPELDGVGKAMEMVLDAYESAFIGEFFSEDKNQFDTMEYVKLLTTRQKEIEDRDKAELARLKADEQARMQL